MPTNSKTNPTHYRTKTKGETVKYGEGDPHLRAKMRVVNILRKFIKDSNHYITTACLVQPEVNLLASYELSYIDESKGQKAILLPDLINPRTPTLGRKRFFHPFDIVVKLTHLNRLVEWIFIEVDGRWHEKKKVQNRDREVERVQRQLIPDGRFVRIDIGDAKYLPEHEIVKLVIHQSRR